MRLRVASDSATKPAFRAYLDVANDCLIQTRVRRADVCPMRLPLARRSTTTYAGRRYRNGVRSWRRAIRWKLLLVFAPFIAASVVWGLVEHHAAAYLAGWLGGGAAGAILALRDAPPAYLQTWGDGDAGERATHNVLTKLGWELIEDVDHGRGNCDHILVGPPGIFLRLSTPRL